MKLEKGMIIEANVEDANEYWIFLVYENLRGGLTVEDLAWVVSPRLEDYITSENSLRVEITEWFGRNRRVSFLASHLPLEPMPLSKMVGYWYFDSPHYEDRHFPHPEILVDPNWHIHERDRIIEYLNSGWVHTAWPGLSFCRFQCGTPSAEMGSQCFTDGEWVWPEGLAHYVEKHDVQLPEEFVDTMRRFEWNAKNRYAEPHQVPKGEHNPAHWIEWCARFKQEQRTI